MKRFIAVAVAFLATASVAIAGVPGPIEVSPDGRHFVDNAGQPFFWLGDTAWPLFAQYSKEQAEAYLQNRGAKGFTVIQGVLAWGHGSGMEQKTPVANAFGQKPWLDDNPSRPNPAYFEHVDHLVKFADRQGLVLAMLPTWGFYLKEAPVLNVKNARAYGRWLGARYKNAPNVVWMMGGDRPATGFENVWRELAAGLREGDGGAHLISYDPCYGRSSAQYFQQDATLSFNMIQTWAEWTSVHAIVLSDALRTPPKPVVHAEGAYENGPEYPTGPITPLLVLVSNGLPDFGQRPAQGRTRVVWTIKQ